MNQGPCLHNEDCPEKEGLEKSAKDMKLEVSSNRMLKKQPCLQLDEVLISIMAVILPVWVTLMRLTLNYLL